MVDLTMTLFAKFRVNSTIDLLLICYAIGDWHYFLETLLLHSTCLYLQGVSGLMVATQTETASPAAIRTLPALKGRVVVPTFR